MRSCAGANLKGVRLYSRDCRRCGVGAGSHFWLALDGSPCRYCGSAGHCELVGSVRHIRLGAEIESTPARTVTFYPLGPKDQAGHYRLTNRNIEPGNPSIRMPLPLELSTQVISTVVLDDVSAQD